MKNMLKSLYNKVSSFAHFHTQTERESDDKIKVYIEITARYFGTFTLSFDGNKSLYNEDALNLARQICRFKPLCISPHEIFNAKFVEAQERCYKK